MDEATFRAAITRGQRRAFYVGITESVRIPVRLSTWSKSGIRVKFLAGDDAGNWRVVHPDDVRLG